MKQIIFSKEAARELRSAPAQIAVKIRAKLWQYAETPAALANNVKAMQGKRFKGCLRLRVGDWRVIFSEAGEVVSVQHIGRRSEIYR